MVEGRVDEKKYWGRTCRLEASTFRVIVWMSHKFRVYKELRVSFEGQKAPANTRVRTAPKGAKSQRRQKAGRFRRLHENQITITATGSRATPSAEGLAQRQI